MEKHEAKEIPWEEQREMLVDFTALQLPKLHQQLMMAYGEEKGQEIYDKIYEMEFQMRSAQFIGKDVGEVMLAEMEIFPALGWKLWVEKREENGVTYWYEHLEHCPPLAAVCPASGCLYPYHWYSNMEGGAMTLLTLYFNDSLHTLNQTIHHPEA